MNLAVKQAWVAALRGGRYVQTSGVLRRVVAGRVTHCCLGVLCEVVGGGAWDEWGCYAVGPAACRVGPPGPVRRAAGLTRAQVAELTRLNDDEGLSFAQIARRIEESL